MLAPIGIPDAYAVVHHAAAGIDEFQPFDLGAAGGAAVTDLERAAEADDGRICGAAAPNDLMAAVIDVHVAGAAAGMDILGAAALEHFAAGAAVDILLAAIDRGADIRAAGRNNLQSKLINRRTARRAAGVDELMPVGIDNDAARGAVDVLRAAAADRRAEILTA